MTRLERGLRHSATPEEFAEAMSICQRGDPSWCSYHAECEFGDCGQRRRASLEDRVKRLEEIVARLACQSPAQESK